jgi:hypothetical protein
VQEVAEMSENYRLYAQKMAQKRLCRLAGRPLRQQLEELLQFVLECEARWAE